jgi:hypothetical protein
MLTITSSGFRMTASFLKRITCHLKTGVLFFNFPAGRLSVRPGFINIFLPEIIPFRASLLSGLVCWRRCFIAHFLFRLNTLIKMTTKTNIRLSIQSHAGEERIFAEFPKEQKLIDLIKQIPGGLPQLRVWDLYLTFGELIIFTGLQAVWQFNCNSRMP